MDINGILETLSGLISVEQITEFLTGIADKVPALAEIINTITGLLGSIGA